MDTKGARSAVACVLAALVFGLASPAWGDGCRDAQAVDWKAIETQPPRFVREEFSAPPLTRLQWAVRAGAAWNFGGTEPRLSSFALIPEVGWTLGGLQWGWRPPPNPPGWTVDWLPLPPKRLSFGLGADALLLPAHWERSHVRPLARLAYGHLNWNRFPGVETALAIGPTFGSSGTGVAGSLSFVGGLLEVAVRYGFTPARSEHSLAVMFGFRNMHGYIGSNALVRQ